jgi:hypothetical protein
MPMDEAIPSFSPAHGPPPRAAWCVLALTFTLSCLSCSGSAPTTPSGVSPSLSAGEWTGSTAQGRSIAFTVSPAELVTSLTVGHRFNGCSGSQTFSNLTLGTAPSVTCIPGPCSGVISSYRSFSFVDGAFGSGPRIVVNGLFLPGGRAEGQAGFFDYPGCGTANGVTWSASRR